jgi:hypothetical protein
MGGCENAWIPNAKNISIVINLFMRLKYDPHWSLKYRGLNTSPTFFDELRKIFE